MTTFHNSNPVQGSLLPTTKPTTNALGFQNNYKAPPKNHVFVVGEHEWELRHLSTYELAQAKNIFDYVTKPDGSIQFVISKEQAAYTYTIPSVQTCAYTAANEYLQSLLGVKLHADDRDWFCMHPLTEQFGLPLQHTLDVIHQLVEPYGIGLSRVYIPKGSNVNENYFKWKNYLGVNPLALNSSLVSNVDYAVTTSGGNKELEDLLLIDADKKYRFEYVDYPVGAFIGFFDLRNGGNGKVVTSFAGGGGHSSYVSPRGNANGWKLAIQLDKLDNFSYGAEVNIPEPESKKAKVLSFANCIGKDGKSTLAAITNKFGAYNIGNLPTAPTVGNKVGAIKKNQPGMTISPTKNKKNKKDIDKHGWSDDDGLEDFLNNHHQYMNDGSDELDLLDDKYHDTYTQSVLGCLKMYGTSVKSADILVDIRSGFPVFGKHAILEQVSEFVDYLDELCDAFMTGKHEFKDYDLAQAITDSLDALDNTDDENKIPSSVYAIARVDEFLSLISLPTHSASVIAVDIVDYLCERYSLLHTQLFG